LLVVAARLWLCSDPAVRAASGLARRPARRIGLPLGHVVVEVCDHFAVEEIGQALGFFIDAVGQSPFRLSLYWRWWGWAWGLMLIAGMGKVVPWQAPSVLIQPYSPKTSTKDGFVATFFGALALCFGDGHPLINLAQMGASLAV
jgi:hypothetical protein